MVSRIPLANTPTALEAAPRLAAAWGGPRIWIKRDDLTGFGLSGNKIRKIEYHAAAARAAGATTLITTGAIQSNHCRAAALAAARVGLECHLLLRTADGQPPESVTGNHLLHRLSGAHISFVDPEQYAARQQLMADLAAELATNGTRAWVIPEGASDYLGMLGFAAAAHEVADQIVDWERAPAVWHPSSSGGTTAGLVFGAAQTGNPFDVVGTSVGDTIAELQGRLEAIWEETRQHTALPGALREPRLTDAYVGGGYAVISDAELESQLEATRLTGLLFDPVYTGKAIHGLRMEIAAGGLDGYDDVIFWHTGGGFGVFAHDFSAVL